jgi:Tfp pilus assembly protein PilX
MGRNGMGNQLHQATNRNTQVISIKYRHLSRSGQDGVALLVVLFALLLLTGVALGLMYMGDTETRVNDNYRSSQQAFYASKGGIEEARDRMRASAPNSLAASMPTTMPSTGAAGVLYLVNPAGASDIVQPWTSTNAYFDTELCQETFNLGLSKPGTGQKCSNAPSGSAWYRNATSTLPFNNTSAALNYKWVRLTYKANGSATPYFVNGSTSSSATVQQTQVCWNGSNEVLLSGAATCPGMGQAYQPVYVLTSLAVTPSGGRRMAQEEIALMTLPPLPSGLTFDGPNPTFSSAPDSNNYGVIGNDSHIDNNTGNSCGSGQPSIPAVGAWDNAAVTALVGAIPSKRAGNYVGSGSTTPDVENINSGLASQWKTVDGLKAVVSLLISLATPSNVYSGNQSGINIGSDASPQITVVNGDLTASGKTRGAGILVVTGNLNFNGNPGFDGIVLVIGKGYMSVSGGGNGEFDGAVFVARTVDASGNPLPSGSAPGSPTVDWTGGGGNGIVYDSCYTTNFNNLFYYQELAFRELAY